MTLPTFHTPMWRVEQILAEHAARQKPEPTPAPLDGVPFKVCFVCKKPQPATREYFYAHKTCADGLDGRCKKCKRLYDRERRDRMRVAARDR